MKKGDLYLSILFLFFTGLIFVFLISPRENSYSRAKFLAKEKEREFLEFNQYVQELKETSEKIKNYQNQISKIETAIPDDPEIFRLFNFIQEKASESGILLAGVGNIVSEEKETTKSWVMDFRINGDYPSFKNFLSLLEKSSRMIRLEKISFSLPQKGENFDFDLKIEVKSK